MLQSKSKKGTGMSAAPQVRPPEASQPTSVPEAQLCNVDTVDTETSHGTFSIDDAQVRKKIWTAMIPILGIGFVLWATIEYQPAVLGGFGLFVLELLFGAAAVYLVWPREPKKRTGH